MAKHAVVGIVRGLAADLVGTAVTACAVSPGLDRHRDAPGDRRGLRRRRRRARLVAERRAGRWPPTRSPPSSSSRPPPAPVVHGSVLHADGGFPLVSAPAGSRPGSRSGSARTPGPATAAARWSAAPARCCTCAPCPADAARRHAGRPRRRLLDGGAAAARPGAGRPVVADAVPADDEVADVTVVVPVRDRPRQLARLLSALPPSLPVLVVDDGSRGPGPTRAVAAEFGARLLRHQVSRGPAAARNTGLARVRTDARRVPGLRRRAGARLARPAAPAPRRPRGGCRRAPGARRRPAAR